MPEQKTYITKYFGVTNAEPDLLEDGNYNVVVKGM